MSSREGSLGASISASTGIGSATDGGAWKAAAGASPGAALRILAHDHARGARDPAVQAIAAQQLLHDEVVVVGVLDGARLDRLAVVRVVGHADGRDALEAFVLERLQKLRPYQDQAFDQRIAREGLLGRLEGAVEVVEDVDELEQQALAPLVEAPLEVLAEPIAEALVLGPHRAVGGEDLGEPILGEAGSLVEGLGSVAGVGRRLEGLRQRSGGLHGSRVASSGPVPLPLGLSGSSAGSSSDNRPPDFNGEKVDWPRV